MIWTDEPDPVYRPIHRTPRLSIKGLEDVGPVSAAWMRPVLVGMGTASAGLLGWWLIYRLVMFCGAAMQGWRP
jgi:hypothetical protein